MRTLRIARVMAAFAVAALIASACNAADEIEGEWTVTQLTGADVSTADELPYIDFNREKGSYSGNTGVNIINGKFKAGRRRISFEAGPMTRMMGSPESMAVEDAFVKGLHSAEVYEVSDSATVLLKGADKAPLMTLSRK